MKGDFSRSTFNRRKHYSSVRLQQGRVQLDSDWNEHIDIEAHLRETRTRDMIGYSGAPRLGGGFEIGLSPDGKDLTLSTGRIYVGGLLCENETGASFYHQPDYPQPDVPKSAAPTDSDMYLAYLDVWPRHITALEDPTLREVALGGPETTTRLKTVWQLKLEKVHDSATSKDFDPTWKPTGIQTGGAMAAFVVEKGATPDNCLYRVEIHDSGNSPSGHPTFKWSRDNGALAGRIEPVMVGEKIEYIVNNIITVSMIGCQPETAFSPGQWVELSDEERVLRGEPGVFAQLHDVQGDKLILVDSFSAPALGTLPSVRRWDSPNGSVALTGKDIALENGVQVRFSEGDYRSGDYWLFSTRAITRQVEWPRDAEGKPALQPPHGIQHHYARLALIAWDKKTFALREDCRFVFSSLADLKALNVFEAEINAPDGAVHVDGHGYMGIGTKTPDKILTVTSSAPNTQIAKFADDTRYIGIGKDEVAAFDLDGKPANLYLGGGKLAILPDGKLGIGTNNPSAKLDILQETRSGTHPTTLKGLYVTGDFLADSNGVEFRLSDASQGIGFGFNTIYATGSKTDQDLGLKARGAGRVIVTGSLQVNNGGQIQLDGSQKVVFSDGDTTNNLKLQLSSGHGLGINTSTLFYAADGKHSWRDKDGANERMLLTTGADGGLTVKGTGISSFAGKLGIGTTTPIAKLDILQGTRSGTHSTTVKGLYVTGDFGADRDGVEFRHSDGSEGIGFGSNTIYATGSTPNQNLGLKARGAGKVIVTGALQVSDGLTVNGAGVSSFAGNVGIGTTNPQAKLDILQEARSGTTHPTIVKGLYVTGAFGADHDGVEFRRSNGSEGIGFGFNTIYAAGSTTNQDLGLKARGTGKVIVTGALQVSGGLTVNGAGVSSFAGNVGIGTTNPQAKLDINGALQASGGLTVKGTGVSSFAGNIGIGTTNPQAKLQIVGGAIMPEAGNSNTAGLIFPPNPGGGSGDSAWMRYYRRGTSGEGTTLEIGTSNDADDHIALMPSGNIGIGTTNPQAKLDVNGKIKSPMWNVTHVIKMAQGSATSGKLSSIQWISGSFTTGGGTLLIFASGSCYADEATKVVISLMLDPTNRGTSFMGGTFLGDMSGFTDEKDFHTTLTSNTLVATGVASGDHTIWFQLDNKALTNGHDYFNLTVLELPF